MKSFQTYDEYVEITNKHRKGSDYKNVYFLKPQIQEFIGSKKLSYSESGSNLYMYEKCDGFSRFYYYIFKDEKPEKIKFDEPLVVEFVYDSPIKDKQAEAVSYLNKLGFELGRRSIRMSLPDIDDFKYHDTRDSDEDIVIGLAEESEAETIRALLVDEFDPRFAFIPTYDELLEIIRDGRIVVSRHGGEIAGFEHFEIANKVLKCWHMLVTPKYQGKGIARRLFSESHKLAKDRASSGQVWLREDNMPAVKLYGSGGYEADNRRSDEFVLE